MSGRVLSLSQLAKEWGWGPQQLYRLIYKREIPFLDLPNGYYFDEEEIEAWKWSRLVAPRTAVPQATPARRPRSRVEECQALGIEPDHLFT